MLVVKRVLLMICFFKPDGSKVYIINYGSKTIYQYTPNIPELLLPSSANIGDEIKIYSKDAIKITQNNNNKIINGSEETTTGTSGYFEVGSNQSVGLIYLGDNVWGVTEQHGNSGTGGLTNLDGGIASSTYGGVSISPIDGGSSSN